MFTFFYGIARVFGRPTFVQVGTDGIVVNRSTGAAILGIDPRTLAFETMRRAGRRIALNGDMNVRGGTMSPAALKMATWRYVGLASLLENSTVCKQAAAETLPDGRHNDYRIDPVAVLNAAYAFYGVEAEAKAA